MTETITHAHIQVQDLNGGWFIARVMFMGNYQQVINEMRAASSQFPGKRVKAVDDKGRLIDIL
jgi:hypothetical protein